MKNRKCLILMAGRGTRMGKKGQFIPKGLWPLLGLKLIDWQVLFMEYLGIHDIWINIFHQKEMFKEYQQKSVYLKNVRFLEEPELLDVGGSVHFFAHCHPQGYSGNLYVSAGDQFLSITPKDIEKIEKNLQVHPNDQHALLSIEVDKSTQHNGIIISNKNLMEGIIPFASAKLPEKYPTYSGMSLIQLDKLSPHQGIGSFFDIVANYKKDPIRVYPMGQIPYWDLGTLDRYNESSKILENKDQVLLSPFDSIEMQRAGHISTHK